MQAKLPYVLGIVEVRETTLDTIYITSKIGIRTITYMFEPVQNYAEGEVGAVKQFQAPTNLFLGGSTVLVIIGNVLTLYVCFGFDH